MSDAVKVRVTGTEDVALALKRLSDAASPNDVRAALKKGAEPIIRSAKGRAPSEDIADGIQIVNIEPEGTGMTMEVGLPGGRQKWFHGLFFELGTGPRVTKAGRRTGSMPADPFLRPAFDSERANARDAYFAELKRRLEAAASGGS